MNHDEISELLGAYALDAVEDDERAVVEEHLVDCARCRAEVEEHREVATLLAHGGGDAPEGVWHRISASLDESPPDLRLVATAPHPPSLRLVPRLAVAAAAAAVVVVGVLGLQVHRQEEQIDDLQAALAEPLVPAFERALADPDSELIELASADGRVVVRGVLTEDGTGYLRAGSLPELPAGRTYQLWGGAGDQLVSLGVLGAEPNVVTFSAEPYELFAITEEEAPGVVASANPPVVAGSTA